MTNDSELEYLRIYQAHIYIFNLLDHNMALCLWYCHRKRPDPPPIDHWVGLPFAEKRKKLLRMAETALSPDDYAELSTRLDECRVWRNVVVHAHWEWMGSMEKPIRYHASEPFDQKGQFTVDEFRERLPSMEETFTLFQRLRKGIERAEDERALAHGA